MTKLVVIGHVSRETKGTVKSTAGDTGAVLNTTCITAKGGHVKAFRSGKSSGNLCVA